MRTSADLDWNEALDYPVGLKVELKSRPGVVDEIACYDEMMVPPIWLVKDPQPRYPHELQRVEPVWSAAVQVALRNAQQTLRRCLT
jgi:hypothetical protein